MNPMARKRRPPHRRWPRPATRPSLARSPVGQAQRPLVIIFVWLLLGEKLTAPTLIGGPLITAGAVVMLG
jgi:drug/metabolite transporter (DMT)-like permease